MNVFIRRHLTLNFLEGKRPKQPFLRRISGSSLSSMAVLKKPIVDQPLDMSKLITGVESKPIIVALKPNLPSPRY
ncbi:hypothetical protein COT02_03260, partial [Candidatus Roizmanbacteria bacterium CG07_land_8_20_14_0_80_34_15]